VKNYITIELKVHISLQIYNIVTYRQRHLTGAQPAQAKAEWWYVVRLGWWYHISLSGKPLGPSPSGGGGVRGVKGPYPLRIYSIMYEIRPTPRTPYPPSAGVGRLRSLFMVEVL
jgi:hypothetical protein